MLKIGITMNLKEERNITVTKEYVDSLVRTCKEVVPILLPVITEKEVLLKMCNLLDGLLLTGGGDIDPKYYKEEPQLELGEINPLRDEMELFLILEMYRQKKPILGICRGCQVLNVAFGGNLFQDITNLTTLQHKQLAPRNYAFHSIKILRDTLLYKIFCKESIRVNSFHHQAINNISPLFKAAARTSDGIIEAIEGTFDFFVVGVQWHPECMQEDENAKRLFSFFLRECLNVKSRL